MTPPADHASLTLLAQRLTSLRAGGIALLALLLLLAQTLALPLAYPNLLLIGAEWLLLHLFVLLSQRKWQPTTLSLTLQLIADVAIVASLLAFSGGVHNPFFALLLLPLLISVGILPLRAQYSLLTVILSAATLLTLLPAPTASHPPQLHASLYALLFQLDGGIVRDTPFNPLDVLARLGLWLNLILMASLTAFFLGKLHQRLHTQQQALHLADTQAREQQHLLTLGLNAASMAHELSTPLATISLLASEAQDAWDCQQPQEARQALTQIQQLVHTCKQQISQSLRQQHLERSDSLRLRPWDDYLREQLAHWQALYPQAQLQLTLDIPPDQSPQMLDLPVLTHSLTSLLANAYQSMPDRPIHLHLQQDKQLVHLCLHDQGPGFPASLLAHFPHPAPSDKPDGHGVGLALAHANFNRLGGSLQLDNPPQGGARVCLTLPLHPRDWQPASRHHDRVAAK